MNPMQTFNPDMPCRVHDRLNDRTFDWRPEWAGHYDRYASEHTAGVIGWDGLLLDGWTAAQS